MKRISLWIALLTLAPSITQAYFHTSPHRLVRYSPYAFSYRNSGLIPGGIKYSPYSFEPGSSGLVYAGTRYTPYAFSYRNPGLVVDYSLWHVPYCCPSTPLTRQGTRACGSGSYTVADRSPRSHRATRQAGAFTQSISAAELRQTREKDGMQIIRRHLQDRGFRDVSVNRILRIDNRTVSADFALRDRGLIVKYWNPEEIESLAEKAPYKQKAFERYKLTWESFAEKHKHSGGKIYCVRASDREDIVAALELCDGLDPGNNGLKVSTMYAKE